MNDLLHLDELHYSTLHGGMVDGFPAVCIELGRTRTVRVEQLLSSISAFGKSLVVKVYGDLHDNGNDPLYALCSSLKEQGYFLVGEIRGNEKRPWVDTLSYKIALIDENPWLLFAANEVRYAPSCGGKIASPTLAAIHLSSWCYLVPHRDNAGEEVLDFLRTHPGFRVYSSKTYRKSISIQED